MDFGGAVGADLGTGGFADIQSSRRFAEEVGAAVAGDALRDDTALTPPPKCVAGVTGSEVVTANGSAGRVATTGVGAKGSTMSYADAATTPEKTSKEPGATLPPPAATDVGDGAALL